MSGTPITYSNKVLHIRPGSSPSESADKTDELLRAASLDVQVCRDVYHGLAQLCRSSTDAPRTVFVCAEELGTAELEFFSITSRLPCSAAVYVYGHERSEARVVRALELGATGRATEQVIRTLGSSSRPACLSDSPNIDVATPVESAAVEPEHTQSTTKAHAAAEAQDVLEPLPETSASVLPESPKVDERQNETRDGAVRVPWLRYSSTPARTPPPRWRGPCENTAPAETPKTRAPRHEPLLTEEELRALIGDDIASIAPAEHHPPADDNAEDTGEGP